MCMHSSEFYCHPIRICQIGAVSDLKTKFMRGSTIGRICGEGPTFEELLAARMGAAEEPRVLDVECGSVDGTCGDGGQNGS